MQVELLQECLDLMHRKQQYLSSDETLVPVGKYTDQARFEVEREVLFRRALNIAGHASEVPRPGDFVTREVVGSPVIIVRGQDGQVRAFLNVCRHRGATVELRDRGHCRRFVCPYHAWAYETNGKLAVVRHADGFPSLDIERTSLVELPCVEGAGLIWVCPIPDAVSSVPDPATKAVIDELDGLGCSDSVVFAARSHVWKANWKILVEGGLESYHFRIAHKETVGKFFPDNISTFQFVGDHIRTVLPRNSIVELAEKSEREWNVRDHTHLVYSIAPGGVVLLQEGHYDLLMMTPLSPDTTRIDTMAVVPNPGPEGHSEKARSFWQANFEFTKQTLDEDFVIGEQIHRGILSGANRFFRFARFEGALRQWHERLDQKCGSAAETH